MLSEIGAMTKITAVVFDVGRVLVQWDLRHLFAKLIDDPEELDWFLVNVLTPGWHFQHDAGRPLADMLPELTAIRQDFHEHPELLFDVHRTAARVADLLRDYGCDEVVEGIGRGLGVTLKAQPLSAHEQERAHELLSETDPDGSSARVRVRTSR